ncbi:MAG: NUDIX domain-containing protein [Alphaproteobacteria bacterium]
MSEFLDIYDENGKHLGVEDRNVVHQLGLWHKTIHCWIVKDGDKIVFQKRGSHLDDNPSKLYTTTSGHLKAGESLEDAFKRETAEELGIQIENPQKLLEVIYKADFITKSGKEFHDRVFCNMFFAKCNTPLSSYNVQTEELDGVVEVNIREVLDLFDGKVKSIKGAGYLLCDGEFQMKELNLTTTDFLTVAPETCKSKYGYILEAILENL